MSTPLWVFGEAQQGRSEKAHGKEISGDYEVHRTFNMAREFSELQVADSWEISFLLFFSPRDPLLATPGGQMAMRFVHQGSITVFLELFCPLFKIAAHSDIKSNIILIRLHLKNTF